MNATVELIIIPTGETYKFKLSRNEILLLNEICKWMKSAYFGDCSIKKEGDKFVIRPTNSILIEEKK